MISRTDPVILIRDLLIRLIIARFVVIKIRDADRLNWFQSEAVCVVSPTFQRGTLASSMMPDGHLLRPVLKFKDNFSIMVLYIGYIEKFLFTEMPVRVNH